MVSYKELENSYYMNMKLDRYNFSIEDLIKHLENRRFLKQKEGFEKFSGESQLRFSSASNSNC